MTSLVSLNSDWSIVSQLPDAVNTYMISYSMLTWTDVNQMLSIFSLLN